jgi:carboxypeptidase Q
MRGSRAHVRQHLGTFEEPKSAYSKLSAYVNIDYGTGRVRSMSVFGPAPAAVALREMLAPFKDLGVLGASAVQSRQSGNSDHLAFSEAGLPGINTLQDPIEYDNYTWHSNLDTCARIVEEEVIKSAIVLAATVYHLAARDQMLPRFSAGEMPKRPGRAQ